MDDWNIELRVGLTGAFLCTQYFGTQMADNGGGVILNIASDLAIIAPDQRIYSTPDTELNKQKKPVTYSVIKHGLIGLTKYTATYWADKNIRCNSISPGGIANDQDPAFVKRLENLIPLGRMCTKSELHGAIQFLCSDASSYMTGHNLILDGGRSIW
jgi:NAD(P)-dependent dehydrogenase (short-subunit alcohol dehydrogenase family)